MLGKGQLAGTPDNQYDARFHCDCLVDKRFPRGRIFGLQNVPPVLDEENVLDDFVLYTALFDGIFQEPDGAPDSALVKVGVGGTEAASKQIAEGGACGLRVADSSMAMAVKVAEGVKNLDVDHGRP